MDNSLIGILKSTADALHGDAGHVLELVREQLSKPLRAAPAGITCVLLIAAGLILALPLRWWLLHMFARVVARRVHDRRLAAQLRAFLAVVISTLAVSLGARLLLTGLETGFSLLPVTRVVAQALVTLSGIAALGAGLGRAIRSADDPELQPFPVPDGLDRALAFYPWAGGALLGLAALVERSAGVLHAKLETRTVAHGLVLAADALLFSGFLIALGRARDQRPARTSASGERPGAIWAVLPLIWALIALGVLAFIAGHVHFAVQLFQQLLWSLIVLGLAKLLVGLAHALIDQVFGDERAPGHFVIHIMGVRPERVTQANLLVNALATVIIWGGALSLIAAPLGSSGEALIDQLSSGVMFGGLKHLKLSPRTIMLAVAVLVAGIVLTRIARRWLEDTFLPATALDVGVRNSIVTGLSYAGILIALLAATNALGISLDKITVIAGALSVGIGFGLQSIIQNFVSGVILLLERPIKVGDWVSTSGAEGSVRRINVRATELETSDGSIAIVPNSSFISSNVQNRSGSVLARRVEIPIRVSGTSKPSDARDAILDLVGKAEGIAQSPAPKVLFTDADDATFGFTLQVHAEDKAPLAEVRSNLLYTLSDGFNAAGIKVKLG